MISEQDKQAILNGVCGITRDGNKAKLLFQSDKNPIDSKYLFLIYGEDVIGLWKNKP